MFQALKLFFKDVNKILESGVDVIDNKNNGIEEEITFVIFKKVVDFVL